MVKFARRKMRPNLSAPVRTLAGKWTRTYEGAPAFGRDAKSDLFLLAITNMVAEQVFYEKGEGRDDRFVRLIHQVTADDPDWVRRFVPWLRNVAQMRSAAVVVAAEYVAAGGPNGREVIASAVARADEPAEVLAYWSTEHGRPFPQPVKRGVADAVRARYNEYAALKYDGLSRGWRMGDVIEMTHPKPGGEWQSDLFRYLLDRRHHPDSATVPATLPMVAGRAALQAVPAEERRGLLRERGNALLDESGATWEWLAGWLPGGMDAEAWETAIPSMGYMALLRNLRNFDEAGVSSKVAHRVRETLADPERVTASRQFPFRFWSAYKHAPSLRWARALEQALEYSVRNIPVLPGRTLVLTDTSASMTQPVSNRSAVRHLEIAALFAAAVAKQADQVELVSFATGWERIRFRSSQSMLRTVEQVERRVGRVGHGTYLGHAIAETFRGQERVVVFSDMQTHDQMPPLGGTSVFVFNTGGYGATPFAVGRKGHYEIGGFLDATFQLMALLEEGRRAGWPF